VTDILNDLEKGKLSTITFFSCALTPFVPLCFCPSVLSVANGICGSTLLRQSASNFSLCRSLSAVALAKADAFVAINN